MGWLKRDGRPKDTETLTSRLVDRPLRPMFAPGWANETQARPRLQGRAPMGAGFTAWAPRAHVRTTA
jgi:hypothetical protein